MLIHQLQVVPLKRKLPAQPFIDYNAQCILEKQRTWLMFPQQWEE
jgi:hypothetical protein